MIVLAIDTSTRWAGVGLRDTDGQVHEHTWRSDQNHGRELMPAIEKLLLDARVEASELDCIGVAIGPGGFSAVRVGMSAATGLGMARGIRLVGISTHALEAALHFSESSPERPLFSALPAGRGELAWARFEGSLTSTEIGVSAPEEFAVAAPPSARICGESAEELARLLPADSFVGGAPPTRSPGTLISLTIEAFERGEAVTDGALKPIYARPPSISRPRPPA